ncbi:MAG: rhodanese-like domain-containing protein [Thermoanaerobaculia bacterium]
MNLRRHLLEASTLVLAAVLCALVANVLASRERKLALPGSYPNALKVPKNGAGASAPAPLPSTAGAAASPPIPFEEKRPRTAPVPTPKAAVQAQESEAKNPSPSSADLLRRFPPHNKPFVEISGDDVAWLSARGALILDARRTKDYEGGHIALARSFPVWESDIDARVTALVGEGRDGAIPVVLYCSGGDCEDSHMLAQKLFGAGFNNLLVYRDGWPDWQKRGGKSAAGPES